jgi:addiction module RelB/DinJ family antitoxin
MAILAMNMPVNAKETASINVQVNAQDKLEATKILSQMGVTMSGVISMLLKQIIIQKKLPFEVTTEEHFKREALETIKEADRIIEEIKQGKRKGYNNMKDFIDSLELDD